MLCAFGSNGNGQLSLGDREDTHIPTRCEVPDDFPTTQPKQIVAGGNHTLVLFECGRLFATGSNRNGECGIPTAVGTAFTRFQRVPPPPGRREKEEKGDPRWALVSAGWDFSILVSTTGTIYSCGRAHSTNNPAAAAPPAPTLQRISPFCKSPIICVSSGMAHTLTVHESGEVYGWGAGRKGQLGEPTEKAVPEPRIVPLPFPAAAAVCGREYSFVVSADGSRHALLGGNRRFTILSDAPPQGGLVGWKKIGGAWGSVVVLFADGTIKAWGRNDRGQLPPDELRGVQDLAVGSEHGVAVVDGKLIVWGWGEHGNCGKEGGGDVVGEVFEVAVAGDGVVGAVGAGCATSWAWRVDDRTR